MRIYQMETTNYCNAKCDYCPHKDMKREKGFMSLETVQKVIDNCKKENQTYIALHHMGEPLLHKDIYTICKMFSDNNIETEFSSNGLAFKEDTLQKLNDSGLNLVRIAMDYLYDAKVDKLFSCIDNFFKTVENPNLKIYIHTVEGNDLSKFQQFPIVVMSKPKDNWAGQIEGESSLTQSEQCYFLDYNYGVVLWNGDIVNCCLDADNADVIGHIDNISELKTRQFSLCKNCVKLQFAADGGWTK